ncbi:MAG: tRNA (adenosine(37)-N6)-dimethylallyltransferase MiaA [Flavobacteriales bacterium]|nr:tRNA (adenosine(37)-N6)-dimethylallyltransferase MiaA [Flavobacteriales bacterium]|tara:strand:- start:6294 stop:7190 length:897 start_codon:yes stop_codon:yes gene_type:complete
MKKTLIIIGGPTAIGKTNLAIKLAKQFKSEIISADARQFYKELNIGVAKPSKYQLKSIKHHFINNISIEDHYSVGKYEQEGLQLIDRLFQKYDVLFLCGGSGLYIDALCEGLNKFPTIKPNIKEQIDKDLNEKGLDFLNAELKMVDIATYEKIDNKNPRRVTRALEVFRSSKKPYSFYLKKEKEKRNFHKLFIGLSDDRETIYNNINQRVNQMIEDGLIDEVKKLYNYRHYKSLQTIGYQEVFDYLQNLMSHSELISKIQQNTRRYAKKQMNWFNKEKYIQIKPKDEKEILKLIESQL